MLSPWPLRVSRWALYLILIVYVWLGSLYAVDTPAWQVPDEPAHYNYIRAIVEQHALPVLQSGDYDQAYLDQLKSKLFPPDLPVTGIRYESWQPPLYYLLAAPVFADTGGSLLAVRLFTLLLGAGVIVLTWRLAREIVPGAPGVALAAAGFVAFLPQHMAMNAAANNDALTEVIIVLGLWLLVRALPERAPLGFTASPDCFPALSGSAPSISPYVRAASAQAPAAGRWRQWPLLGLVLGLGFLTKLTAYPLAGLIAAGLLLAARRQAWPRRRFVIASFQVYVPAILLGSLWWVRNIVVYGGLDFLATTRHDSVVLGQPRTADLLAQWGVGLYVRNFFQTTFQSFWGQFGWMGVLMDQRVYLALLLYSAGLLLGLLAAAVAFRRSGRRLRPEQADVLVLLALAIILAVMVYLYYNLTFVQFQGRYLYPALSVLALGAALALRQWARLLTAFMSPAKAALRLWTEWALPLVPIALMAVLDLFALYRFIIPALTRPS
jgi:4-amino-4-deoxy-L-arabinose transferase-like glycosyltransferase